ncbi:MAG: hypothetical protein ACWGOV_08705, partial [Acidiferrobacterales bacterium]
RLSSEASDFLANELSVHLPFTKVRDERADESGLRVCFLFGYFFFAQTKKKYLGYRDQPRLIVVKPAEGRLKI